MIEDSFGLIIAVFLGIVLLIVYPMYHIYQTQDAMVQMRVVDEVDLFVNDIKTSGVLKQHQYEQFVASLSSLGMSFDVDITHRQKVLYPEYSDPKDVSTFTGEVITTYDEFASSEILSALYDHTSASDGYHFKTGDVVVVSVKSVNKSRSDKLRETIWRTTLNKPSYFTRFSGIIINETN